MIWSWDIINFILQIVAIILIPFTIWLLKTVIDHSSKLSLLEQKVNDSVSIRLQSLETKINAFETKLESVHVNIAKNNAILDHLNQNVTYIIKKMDKEHE
jgi:hypothetical protein